MNNKKDKDVTWLVNIILVAGLTFLLCGQFGGCTTSKVEGETAEYWYKAFIAEREIRVAQSDLLHRIYGNGDNEPWFDLVMSTPEYWRLDSVLNAAGCGWEDFYYYDEYTAGYADGDTIETPVDYQY